MAVSRTVAPNAFLLLLATVACDNRPDSSSSSGTAASPRRSDPWFQDIAAASGIAFRHRTDARGDYLFPEIIAGGVGLLDYDRDGLLDVFFVQAGSLYEPGLAPGHRLYRNLGNGRFLDVTEQARVAGRPGDYGMGCAAADYDNDGDVDLYITSFGANALYRNNGDGTFDDVTAASGVPGSAWGLSAAFLDFDADGLLDLAVANYVRWSRQRELPCHSGGQRDYCLPNNYSAPLPDTLYRNLGDGRFADVSEAAGLRAAFGNGMGLIAADVNSDGRLDLFVANDSMPNQLWINQGGRFLNQARDLGCAVNRQGVVEANMGIALADLDDNGTPDLFVSHLRDETNTLFVNEGGVFTDLTARAGLGLPSLPTTGFGTGFADFDNDGILDCYVANGAVLKAPKPADPADPYAEPCQLFRGREGLRFEEILPRGGTKPVQVRTSRGAAFGDLDNDGGIDIVVVNKDAAPFVLRNVVASRGHWVMFRVLNRHGSDAIGAELRIESGGKTRIRYANPAYSYCATNDPRVHCGLAAATRVDRVTVRWPTGQRESFGPFNADSIYELLEGKGIR